MQANTDQAAGDVLTVGEAAPLLRRSTEGVYRAIRKGHIPPGVYFRIGRDIYVSRQRLLEWRDAGGNALPVAEHARGAACSRLNARRAARPV